MEVYTEIATRNRWPASVQYFHKAYFSTCIYIQAIVQSLYIIQKRSDCTFVGITVIYKYISNNSAGFGII